MVFPWCLDRGGHGNIQRILAIARHLSQRGVAVDLVYQGNPSVPATEKAFAFCRRVIRVDAWRSSDDVRLTREIADFYSGYEPPPANLGPGTALTAAVRGLLDAVDYTAVLCTYAWTAPIFEPLARRALRIVDVQDVMSLHGERSRTATGTTSPFSLSAETERYLWRKWDVLLAITPEEAAIIAPALRPSQQLLTVGHAVEVPEVSQPATTAIVYAGSDNPANQQAVRWLLTEVWPLVLRSHPWATLRLVGLIGDAVRNTPLASTSNLEIVGFVSQPALELAQGAIAVAPYLYGSGLKIKVLEAAGLGRPVVTTSHGAEGTGLVAGEHVLIGDTAEEFAAKITSLLDDPRLGLRIGSAARNVVQQSFSPAACYDQTLDVIRKHGSESLVPGVIPASVEDRLRSACAVLGTKTTVVVWGNGSHTRALVPLITRLGVPLRCIVDKGAVETGLSVEHLPVVTPHDVNVSVSDLIVLSSQMYEGEMWADLETLRRAGAHVLALYRRELVSEDLGLALRRSGRTTTRLTRQTAAGGVDGRLIISEPSAGRSRGPFLRLAQALKRVAADRGLEVVVAGARRVLLDDFEPDSWAMFESTFEFAHWDMLREGGDDIWRSTTRFARIMSVDLASMADRMTLTRGDVVLFHTANLVEVIAVGMWLSRMEPQDIPQIRLLFHFTLAQEAQWLKTTEPELRHAYALAMAMLEERAGDRVQLIAQNDVLAPLLAEAFDRNVLTMGFALPASNVGRTRDTSVPVRLLFAGEARADKGFGLLPAVADYLRSELASGQVTLVCQCSQNEFADEAIRLALAQLAAQPGIELINGFLSSAEYDRLMTGCDLVLLPYDAEQYRSRLSAVFVDATAAGIPVVVPDATWMSGQLADGLGAGVTFGTLTATSIGDAIRRTLNLDNLTTDAQAARAKVWQQHHPESVLASILGVGPGATPKRSRLIAA